ncbi:MAG TPA: hypothetical protein PLY45_02110 [bacterium]|nr:hypothetical protein [bacterium]
MFTEADFVAYFAELEILERNMRDVYDAALGDISDPEIRRVFESLRNSEENHARLVEELRRIAIRKSMGGG